MSNLSSETMACFYPKCGYPDRCKAHGSCVAGGPREALTKQQNTCDLAGWLHKPDCTCQYRKGAPVSSKKEIQRPMCIRVLDDDGETERATHFRVVDANDYDEALAEIERLRAALTQFVDPKCHCGLCYPCSARKALSGDGSVVETPCHPDPTGKTREPPHCPSCSCGLPEETEALPCRNCGHAKGQCPAFNKEVHGIACCPECDHRIPEKAGS